MTPGQIDILNRQEDRQAARMRELRRTGVLPKRKQKKPPLVVGARFPAYGAKP
jgi:hypothetical protein